MMKQKNTTPLHIPNFPFALHIETHGEQDLVSRMIQNDKIWEAYETQLITENVNQGDCVLDIGANIGYYSLIASKLVGDKGKVISFEPEQENFSLLQKNIKNNQLANVDVFLAGLGNKKESIPFFKCKDNRGDHRAFNADGERQESKIDILVGDDVIKEQRVDFIKIDTQGFELAILQGLRKTLAANQVYLKMVLEFWPFALEKNGASAEKLLKELQAYHFKIQIIDHINHVLIDTDLEKLKQLALNDLTPESQGFINLWLTPDTSARNN